MTVDRSINGERAFAQLFEQLGYGSAIADLSREYEALMANMHAQWVERGGKLKAKMIVTLSFELDEDGVMQSGYDSVAKAPRRPRPGAMLFMNKKGQLQPDNPRQAQLPGVLRDVTEHRRSTVRDVGDVSEASGADESEAL